ncbi:MAG: glycerophosphodiester phosphodiesterase [Eubacterium sp.]|nr:glycerophosphodiester phosphodiesterase [Eubacterium sp.]
MIYFLKSKKLHTKVIAHRGASHLARRENTIESFEIAIKLKADMVEFDVRQTKDNELVVFHDSVFNEMPIAWQNYEDMKKAAAAEGFEVPLLIDVVKLCKGRIRMDVEIKESGYEERVVKLLTENLDYNEYSIKSFKDEVVKKIKELDSSIVTGLLIGKKHASPWNILKQYFPERRLHDCRADFVSPNYKLVTRFFVRRMHMRGIPVLVWTVNDKKKMLKLFRMKVNAIITDKPDAALYIRKKYLKQ